MGSIAVDMNDFVGMDLCNEALKEIMPLSGDESTEGITSLYLKATSKHPELWPELTLATLNSMIEKSVSISAADKLALSGFLSSAAERYDTIQSS